MKPYAEITMYSGACHLDPRVELTEEQCIVLEDKIFNLEKPFTGNPLYGTGVLGPESYMVVFPEDIVVYVTKNGAVRILTIIGDYVFQDTTHLHAYLSDLLAPALIQHVEDAKKMWEEHNEKMFRISNEEKI